MELETLNILLGSDQQIFLLGRIALETSRLDAALRFVNAALRGHRNVDAFLDAPDNFSANVRSCTKLANAHDDLADKTRTAVLDALAAAAKAYRLRNRYTHDFLREEIMHQGWELAPLTRQPEGAPEFVTVSFDDMVDLVRELVTATWRLRGCALFVLGGRWEAMAMGAVQGEWDGSATSSR